MLEGIHVLQEKVAAQHVIDGVIVCRIAFHQLFHDDIAVVAEAKGILGVDKRALVKIGLKEGFLFGQGMNAQGCKNAVGPSLPYEGFLKDAQIFAGCLVVAFDEIDFCQSLDHADVAVVGRAYICQHGCSFAEGHVAQYPVQLIECLDGECWSVGTKGLKGAEVVVGEFEKVGRKTVVLCHDEIIVELHVLVRILFFLYDVHHLVVVAEIIFAVYSQCLFQIHLWGNQFADARISVDGLEIAIVEPLGEHEEEKWDDQGGKTIVGACHHDIGNAAGKCQGAIYPYTVSEEPMADEYGDEDADDGYPVGNS